MSEVPTPLEAAGQICMASSRHLVHASVADEYTALLAQHPTLRVHVAVYLLALRHPVPGAPRRAPRGARSPRPRTPPRLLRRGRHEVRHDGAVQEHAPAAIVEPRIYLRLRAPRLVLARPQPRMELGGLRRRRLFGGGGLFGGVALMATMLAPILEEPASAIEQKLTAEKFQWLRRLADPGVTQRLHDLDLPALQFEQDLNQKEIALVLGVTEGRVSQLRSQAVARIRASLAKDQWDAISDSAEFQVLL